jgi:hypothetical protein
MPVGNALAVIRSFRPFPPVITSDGTITWVLNVPNFNYNITATNNPTSFNAIPLPAGLSVNTTTGSITGTPTVVNVSGNIVTISAKNKAGTGTKNLIIKILPPPPVITSVLTLTGFVGVPLTYNILATNMLPTYLPSYKALDLPSGLNVNISTGVINGSPASSGITNTNIFAINAGGSDNKILVIDIKIPPPVVTQPPNFTQAVNTSFNYQILATNNPTFYSATGLPTGLTINNASGLISGTLPNLTTNQTFTVQVNASNSTGIGIGKFFTITVVAPPIITNASNFGGNVGTSITSPTPTVTNGPVSWSFRNKPAFLSNVTINNEGRITGFLNTTTEQQGQITIEASNIAGTGSATVQVFAFVPTPPATAVTRIFGENGAIALPRNVFFTQTLTTDGTQTNLAWTITGTLPPGITFNNGVISGTPTTVGNNYFVTVSVRNNTTAGGNATWSRNFGVTP